jgi:hypothetical protein
MADEDLGLEEGEIKNKVEKRIKDLSEKVKLTAGERDELAKGKTDAETAQKNAEKERDFYSSFADSAGSYPEASNYKDAIKEKVMSGYSVEDATVSVLAKEGKLNNYTPPSPKHDSPAGGSATNAVQTKMEKPLNEMTKAEKREALIQMENETGGVSNALRQRY